MKKTIYIFKSGILKRKDNTILFKEKNGESKFIPVENVDHIMVFGEVDINKRILEFLSKKEIILSYYNYYGYYMGSFYPREHYNSGFMIVNQVKHYTENILRMKIAKTFVKGATLNSLKILKYYNRRKKDLESIIDTIEHLIQKIDISKNINELMAIEGNIKNNYFQGFNEIIDDEKYKFIKRTRRPPEDKINALISFSNSIIYNLCLNTIYKTHLDPRIGFLHTSNFRSFSLNLDIAEIFKPVIGDRTIFSLINKGVLSEKHFEKNLNKIYLNEKGKKLFLKKYEERLIQTINHSKLNKQVSYRQLVKLELYKLEKHLMKEKDYEPFIMDW